MLPALGLDAGEGEKQGKEPERSKGDFHLQTSLVLAGRVKEPGVEDSSCQKKAPGSVPASGAILLIRLPCCLTYFPWPMES